MTLDSGYVPEQVLTDADEVQAILGEQFENQVKKVIDHIDDHCRAWIERSPFVVVSTASAAGAIDVAPKGDPPGFVRVLDRKTLAVPDRPGNHRGDTFRNVIENPQVGLMFVVPKRREVVRVSGTAVVVNDPPLLASMAVGDKVPTLALVVTVHEAMFHCGKSMIRSHMWEPELWGSVDGLPTYAQALVDHGALDTPVPVMEQAMQYNEECRLYDE
ncbi:MAG TPA: MSMEG_1061 family FMN-dependent PPOX-type flavoprotein [Acidimicrobiales bacterium]|nr:MSMEG_1061 family FMN-dependent PPOX-type flavoprotein [Acidimicrobiales bacterium]